MYFVNIFPFGSVSAQIEVCPLIRFSFFVLHLERLMKVSKAVEKWRKDVQTFRDS